MQNVDRDIIVIGAGGCGLMAALVAAKKGARVLLLEKTDKPGGGTAFSSKGIRAAARQRCGRQPRISGLPWPFPTTRAAAVPRSAGGALPGRSKWPAS